MIRAPTIVVADDRPESVQLVRDLLQMEGYRIVAAYDGQEALDRIRKHLPDLVLLDLNMPHMDGFEFVAALKADSSLPSIPVIFLTSVEDGDARGKELGAVGYVTKPVRADRLLSLVAQHVPGGAIPIG